MTLFADEDLFLRFADDGDADALDELFRRRAGELLCLALHLARQPDEAEDLLQSTFLSAIRARSTFRRGAAVMPWLVAILTNHARMVRRAEARSRRPAWPREDEPPADEAALLGEIREQFAFAVQRLAEPYRQVLRLHFDEGLDSREIGDRLGRPPATVRKQVERGLARLRELLPLGLASSVAVLALGDRALAAAATAARNAGAPAASAAVTLGGTSRGAKRLAAVLAATLAAVSVPVAWLAWPAAALGSPAGTSAAEPGAPTRLAAAEAAPPSLPAVAAVPEPSRRDAGARLTVQLSWQDGSPAREVDVRVVPEDDEPLSVRQTGEHCRRERTDEDGLAVFAGLPGGRVRLSLAGSLRGDVLSLVAGREERVARALGAPTHLRGVVVSAAELPVAGARVFLSQTSGRLDAGDPIATSAADGTFRCTLASDEGKLWAAAPGLAPSRIVKVRDGKNPRLVLGGSARALRGRLEDCAGGGIAGGFVAAVPQSDGFELVPPIVARSGTDGSFSFDALPDTALALVARAGGFAPAAIAVAADADVVPLRLSRGGTIRGAVLDERGVGVAELVVLALPPFVVENQPVQPLAQRATVTGADGSFELRNVPAGTAQVAVTVRIDAGSLASRARMEVKRERLAAARVTVVDGETVAWEPIVARPHELRGRVVDGAGNALAGYDVELLPDEDASWTFRAFRARGATTDENGCFRVLPPPASALRLCVFAPAPRERLLPVATFAVDGSNETVATFAIDSVPPWPAVAGSVTSPDGSGVRASLRVERPGHGSRLPVDVAADGSFRLGSVSPGPLRLWVEHPDFGARRVSVAVPAGAAAVQLRAVAFEAPARLTVRLARPGGAAVVRVLDADDVAVAEASFGCSDGSAPLPPLQPGLYRVVAIGADVALEAVTVNLTAGAQRELALEPPAGVATRLRFPFRAGDNPFTVQKPLRLWLRDGDGAPELLGYVDAIEDEAFVLPVTLRPGRHRVAATSLWGAHGELEFTIAAGSAPRDVLVPLER